MLRCMILLFSFLLITLSAAHLGRDEQMVRALGLRRDPAMEVREEAPDIPIESSQAPPSFAASDAGTPPDSSMSAPPVAPSSSRPESAPPRFVPDEPLPEYSLPPEPEEEPSAVQPLDPSAHALVSPAESQGEYVPPVLTEEQKLKVAEPYVKELFALKENALRAIGELGDQAIGDYLAADPSARSAALPAIAARYLPQVQTLIDQADRQAGDILMRMTGALAAIGADDGIVQDARAAYERSKQEEIDRYTRIFAELPS